MEKQRLRLDRVRMTATGLLYMVALDVYRMIVATLDWRCHWRVLNGKGKYDVAFINNLECGLHKSFLGLRRGRKVAYTLRFSLGGRMCRSLIINSSARDLMRPKSRQLAAAYTREAIAMAVRDGARIILFAAGTKRLFSEAKLAGIRMEYPEVVFTIGDNGTAIALLTDVLGAIKSRAISRDARMVVLGPNGFLGGVTVRFLWSIGYRNLCLVSSGMADPYAGVDEVELIVACSHDARLRLTAEVLSRIAHRHGVYVVDVCRPANLSRKEFLRCRNVIRQDAGMVHSPGVRYVFSMGARFMLARLGITTRVMYGCFGEAVALSALPHEEVRGFDFLSVNKDAIRLVERAFALAGFSVSPVHNYGTAMGKAIPAASHGIAEHLYL